VRGAQVLESSAGVANSIFLASPSRIPLRPRVRHGSGGGSVGSSPSEVNGNPRLARAILARKEQHWSNEKQKLGEQLRKVLLCTAVYSSRSLPLIFGVLLYTPPAPCLSYSVCSKASACAKQRKIALQMQEKLWSDEKQQLTVQVPSRLPSLWHLLISLFTLGRRCRKWKSVSYQRASARWGCFSGGSGSWRRSTSS
jgi:hypothetical protein